MHHRLADDTQRTRNVKSIDVYVHVCASVCMSVCLSVRVRVFVYEALECVCVCSRVCRHVHDLFSEHTRDQFTSMA
jgi:hypothetical protein